jgi:hypothetical protein
LGYPPPPPRYQVSSSAASGRPTVSSFTEGIA